MTKPNNNIKCNCNEMSCKKGCDKKHTHKGFSCGKCEEKIDTIEEIIKEFDIWYENNIDYCQVDGADEAVEPSVLEFKTFLRQALLKENNPPMGTSQWLAHGKKYGYDTFFIDKAILEGARKYRDTIRKDEYTTEDRLFLKEVNKDEK